MFNERNTKDTPDRFFFCWSCRNAFSAAAVRKDGIIQSRKERHGGPFYSYECPKCKSENKCEPTCKGHFFASSPYRPSLADWLLEKLGPAFLADDFLRISAWFEREEDRRQFLFERDGDFRYSSWREKIRLFNVRRKKKKARESYSFQPEKTPPSIPSPYKILGVSPGASNTEIKKAFHRLIRKYHPDKAHHLGREKVKLAEKRFKELLEAYEKLVGAGSN